MKKNDDDDDDALLGIGAARGETRLEHDLELFQTRIDEVKSRLNDRHSDRHARRTGDGVRRRRPAPACQFDQMITIVEKDFVCLTK